MLEGGSIVAAENDSVTGNKTVREMETRIRELERQLERKTLENEVLKEALEKSRSKKDLACAIAQMGLDGKCASSCHVLFWVEG